MPDRSTESAPFVTAAELWRGGVRESVHLGAWVETDVQGRVLNSAGDPDLVTTMRSAGKPLQALALFSHPDFLPGEVRSEETAICCSSHAGEPRHAALAASVLALSGYLPDNLVCGAAGDPPSPLKHGCSGNHAAILLLARTMGAPLEGYHLSSHPAQQRITELMSEITGFLDLRIVPDACGIPTCALPLRGMARAFARLAGGGPIPEAMMTNTDLIGPPEHADVRIMKAFPGRIVAKTGAEGLICLGLMSQGRGIALKIADGAPRAVGPVALEILRQCGWITPEEYRAEMVANLREPRFTDSLGWPAARLIVPGG